MQAMAKYSQAEHPARIVAMALAFYAERQSNLAWPSDEALVGWAKVSRSQLYRALKSLEGAREIQRQPRVPGGPRRVYLIDPMRASQLPLFESNVPPLAPSSPRVERVTRENERSTRGRGEGTTRTVNPTPPSPPRTGGERRTYPLKAGTATRTNAPHSPWAACGTGA